MCRAKIIANLQTNTNARANTNAHAKETIVQNQKWTESGKSHPSKRDSGSPLFEEGFAYTYAKRNRS
ncbi:hypothetical protein SNOG_05671 [Parastagonospora nodorum SN15]|uniref:Uncharacterized protein n=1 Tax=Phaeosphaeria nodorum (strain SN15 / ATCC MYA-4574 / FGSC 10173) TaxID=321614 RepID=Q0URE3_PHANO|nr:hypothetical protein SNOG_05671 [Parastagonospora nodorum SN15]EAT86735.1 hypothetical protein SNOG_05671 [Parastagonospora nodorum SN15]